MQTIEQPNMVVRYELVHSEAAAPTVRPQPLMRHAAVWIAIALVFALGVRAFHYLSNPPVWHDEAALIMNVIGKSYPEHFGKLFYSEAAPPLFMWLEKSVTVIAGDGSFALRFFPWLASCVLLVGMVTVCRRLLTPWSLLALTLMLGFSDRLLFHCCEAKPYTFDALLVFGLMALLVRLDRHVLKPRGVATVLFGLTCLTPLLIFFSFPACFLLGGVSLAFLADVWRARSVKTWLVYGLFLCVLCGSFLLLYLGPIHAQRSERLLNCWTLNFPNWDQPWWVPVSTIIKLTETSRYACEPIGGVLSVFAIIGATVLWRRGYRRLVVFLVVPTSLASFAWLLGHYPIGATRVMTFAAPAALLLIAAGLPAGLAQLGRLRPVGILVVAGLMAFVAGQAVYRMADPWFRNQVVGPNEYVLEHRQTGEPIVGSLWEHSYYFRHLGEDYRSLYRNADEPPSLPPTMNSRNKDYFVESFWMIIPNLAESVEDALKRCPPVGHWEIVHKKRYRDLTVAHVRRSVKAGSQQD